MEEDCTAALEFTKLQQARRKKVYDKKLKKKNIVANDLVLVYDSRYQKFPGKLHTRWTGPYTVLNVWDNGSL